MHVGDPEGEPHLGGGPGPEDSAGGVIAGQLTTLRLRLVLTLTSDLTWATLKWEVRLQTELGWIVSRVENITNSWWLTKLLETFTLRF